MLIYCHFETNLQEFHLKDSNEFNDFIEYIFEMMFSMDNSWEDRLNWPGFDWIENIFTFGVDWNLLKFPQNGHLTLFSL